MFYAFHDVQLSVPCNCDSSFSPLSISLHFPPIQRQSASGPWNFFIDGKRGEGENERKQENRFIFLLWSGSGLQVDRLQAVGEEETRLVVYGLHRGFDPSATTQKPLSDPTAPRPQH
jgi:hypothetical protein